MVFLRLVDIDDRYKQSFLAQAAAAWRSGEESNRLFKTAPSSFNDIPGSPFSYWVGERVRAIFTNHPPMDEGGRSTHIGLSTKDDTRYVRTWWEVPPESIGRTRAQTLEGRRWVTFIKGGRFAPFYADMGLLVDWYVDGRILKTDIAEYRGSRGWGYNWSAAINGHSYYFSPGMTWPRRAHLRSAFALVPVGTIFGSEGPMWLSETVWQDALITNSEAHWALLSLLMARGLQGGQTLKLEVGYVSAVPVPDVSLPAAEIEAIVRRAWSNHRSLVTVRPTEPEFLLPALLRVGGDTLRARAEAWSAYIDAIGADQANIRYRMDDIAYRAYGITEEDREQLDEGFGTKGSEDEGDSAEGEETEEVEEVDLEALTEALLEWVLGVALGRFDVRLAIGKRTPPPDPDPFDALPVCSPGMLQDDNGLPAREAPAGYPLELPPRGILVDDPGHPWDVVARIEAILEQVAEGRAHEWLQEAEGILGRDLRDWLRRYGFERHLKRYSRSRRKAPLFWYLAPKSSEYGIWLYSPGATRDTFYRVQNDYVEPKVKAAERRLLELRQIAGASPTGQQRKDLASQESLVEDLRAFGEQVELVAPLWKPHRDDGVVLNCGILSRLFDHHRSWQKECAKKWGELAGGKYDWAGWAMHLWPARVVATCASDRSIAIAHGLEEALWEESEDGKWEPRADAEEQVAKLVAERRSPAVQAALDAYERGRLTAMGAR